MGVNTRYINSTKGTSSGCYIPCVYLHARWSYCRWFRFLLLCPSSVKCCYFPLLVDSTQALKASFCVRLQQSIERYQLKDMWAHLFFFFLFFLLLVLFVNTDSCGQYVHKHHLHRADMSHCTSETSMRKLKKKKKSMTFARLRGSTSSSFEVDTLFACSGRF